MHSQLIISNQFTSSNKCLGSDDNNEKLCDYNIKNIYLFFKFQTMKYLLILFLCGIYKCDADKQKR